MCKYYLAGHCTYGDKCRYDHKKPEWSQAAKPKQYVFSVLLSYLIYLKNSHLPGTCKCGFGWTLQHDSCSACCSASLASAASSLLTLQLAHRVVPKPAAIPKDETGQTVRQMQSLSLQPQKDITAWDSGPGPLTSATSQANSQPDYSTYDPQRDSTAQPMSAWQNQGYNYHDAYSYNGYGGYYDQETYAEETYAPELGDDWDQLGFALEPDSAIQGDQRQQHSGRSEAARRTPSERQLCSQFQVSGECPRGSSCHMAHGDLCEVCCLHNQAVFAVYDIAWRYMPRLAANVCC